MKFNQRNQLLYVTETAFDITKPDVCKTTTQIYKCHFGKHELSSENTVSTTNMFAYLILPYSMPFLSQTVDERKQIDIRERHQLL